MSSMALEPITPQATVLPSAQWLTKNPQLAVTPLGAYTDSQYEAAAAKLRGNIQRQYADILEQLGYKNDAGQFIPGTVEADAAKQRTELERSQGLAVEGVTQGAQREGTLFSGLRAVNQARAEHPFVSALSDLAVNTPRALAKLYENAAGLTDQYTLENNVLLADAAARQAALFAAQPAPPVVTPPSGGQGNQTPPPVVEQPQAPLIPVVNPPYNQAMEDFQRTHPEDYINSPSEGNVSNIPPTPPPDPYVAPPYQQAMENFQEQNPQGAYIPSPSEGNVVTGTPYPAAPEVDPGYQQAILDYTAQNPTGYVPGTSQGNTRVYYTYKNQVPLLPGQRLDFTTGKGYYAR